MSILTRFFSHISSFAVLLARILVPDRTVRARIPKGNVERSIQHVATDCQMAFSLTLSDDNNFRSAGGLVMT